MCFRCLFFFFKQKTAYEMRISDWSSDVCSSDLARPREDVLAARHARRAALRRYEAGKTGEALRQQPEAFHRAALVAPRDQADRGEGLAKLPLSVAEP